MENKILLIVNPVAGSGNIKKDVSHIIENFNNSGFEVDTEFTIVCSECHIYVIIDRDELSVVRIKISSKDFIKGVLAEITENLDAWASCSINSSEDTEESGRPILSHKMQLSHYTNYILHCLGKESAK